MNYSYDEARSLMCLTASKRNLSDTFHQTQRKVLDDRNISKSVTSNFHHAKMETLRKHEEKAIAMGIKNKPRTTDLSRSVPSGSSSSGLILSNFTTTKSRPHFGLHYHPDIINQVKSGKGDAYKVFKTHLDHCHTYVYKNTNPTDKSQKPTKKRIKWSQKQVDLRKMEKEKEDFVLYNQQLADPKLYNTIRNKGEFNDGLCHEKIW